jgi:multidrug transporter EmrE-like cation transporter
MSDLWYVLISVLLNVSGQLCLKKGALAKGPLDLHMNKLLLAVYHAFSNPFIILGLFLYGISAFFWIIALSRVDLSYAYPILSLGYILIMLLSYWFFQENLSTLRVLGTLTVVVGLCLIFKS